LIKVYLCHGLGLFPSVGLADYFQPMVQHALREVLRMDVSDRQVE
jgi:hypothetical protein